MWTTPACCRTSIGATTSLCGRPRTSGDAPQVGLARVARHRVLARAPPPAELIVRQRAGEQEALRLLAPVAAQELELRLGLDAFGDAAQAQRVGQRDDRVRDCLVVGVLLQAVHEASVDLDALDRQSRKVGKARIAGAEVI